MSAERSPYLFFDSMTWPDPTDPHRLQWRLRNDRDSLNEIDLLIAASFIAAYSDLIYKPRRRREEVIGKLRTEIMRAEEAEIDSYREVTDF